MFLTTYYRVCNQINTTGATSGTGTAYPSGAPEFTSGFQWGSCYSIFSFICMLCRSLFVLLCFFFWLLCCLFFDIRFLIGIFKLFFLTWLFTFSTNSTGVVMMVLFIIFRQTVHCLPGICFVQIDTKNDLFPKLAVIINVNYQMSAQLKLA